MNSGLYVRAGACATARLAACAISLFGPTTNDSNVFRGLSPGTVAPGFVARGNSSKTSFNVVDYRDVCAATPEGEQKFTERGPPNVVTLAVCNAGMYVVYILHRS